MSGKEHEQFHRDAARRGRRAAAFEGCGEVRDTWMRMTALHERAANGEKLFADCCELVTDDDTAGEVQS